MNFILKKTVSIIRHIAGRLNNTYYCEDYVRVYPDGQIFNSFGKRRDASVHDINNYLNHSKFYQFSGQFVSNKDVADIGCGSGYGSKILKEHGACSYTGFDISTSSINFAKAHFNTYGTFEISSITDISQAAASSYDITICSEVLEHIKEYRMEQRAIDELKRITRQNGLLILGTPNSELLKNHGFSYEEIHRLVSRNFSKFCIFENAFVPFGERKQLWLDRLKKHKTGIIISENINLKESCFPKGSIPELKKGLDSGKYTFEDILIDTNLLHNTHSWVIIALNEP